MRAVSSAASGFLKFGFEAGEFGDLFLRGAQRRGGRSIPFIEQIEGLHGSVVDFFRVRQNALFGFEAFVFARLQLRFFDLAVLKYPQIDQAEAILLALFQLFDTIANSIPGFVRRRYWRQLASGKAIQ